MLNVCSDVRDVLQNLSTVVEMIMTLTIHMCSSMSNSLISNLHSHHKMLVPGLMMHGGQLEMLFRRIGQDSMHNRQGHRRLNLFMFHVAMRPCLPNVKGHRWNVKEEIIWRLKQNNIEWLRKSVKNDMIWRLKHITCSNWKGIKGLMNSVNKETMKRPRAQAHHLQQLEAHRRV
jgi:hypothetical protein